MEQIVKFIEDHPASAGLPYWGGVYSGCGDYILIIADRRIIGVVNDPFDAPGYKVRREAAKQEAVARGYNNVSTALAEGSGGSFFLRYKWDAEMLPTKKYYVPSVYGGRHLNIEVIE